MRRPGMAVTVLIQLVPQGTNADVEQLCRMSPVTFAPFQRSEDVALFELAKGAKLVRAANSRWDAFVGSESEMRRLQSTAFTAQNDCAFDDILQFPHIARPGMVLQCFHTGQRQAQHFYSMFAGEPLAKLIGPKRDVPLAFAYRGAP